MPGTKRRAEAMDDEGSRKKLRMSGNKNDLARRIAPQAMPERKTVAQDAVETTAASADPSSLTSQTLQLLHSELDSLRQMLTCKICERLYYEPYVLACGHTYCYSCLSTWFTANRKKPCPNCRVPTKQQPAPSYVIKDMVQLFVKRSELLPDGETQEQHTQWQQEEAQIVQKDRDNQDTKTGGLFRGVFKEKRQPFGPIHDSEDNVDRCPRCNWELEDNMCQRCGIHMDDDSDSDSDSFGDVHGLDGELDDDLDLQDSDSIFDGASGDSEDLARAIAMASYGGEPRDGDGIPAGYASSEVDSVALGDHDEDINQDWLDRGDIFGGTGLRQTLGAYGALNDHDSEEEEDDDDDEDGSMNGFLVDDDDQEVSSSDDLDEDDDDDEDRLVDEDTTGSSSTMGMNSDSSTIMRVPRPMSSYPDDTIDIVSSDDGGEGESDDIMRRVRAVFSPVEVGSDDDDSSDDNEEDAPPYRPGQLRRR